MRTTVLAFALAALAQGQDPSKLLRIPGWFALFEPESQKIVEKTTEKISLSYDADSKFEVLVGNYETSLKAAWSEGVSYTEEGNGHGTTFRIASGDRLCKLDLAEQAKPHVDFECKNNPAPPVAVAPPTPPPAAKATLSPEPPAQAKNIPGSHRVEYVVEGSAPAAVLSYRNAAGSTEQKEVAVPASIVFDAAVGALASISAQRKGDTGAISVSIKLDGLVVQHSLSAPSGTASASAKVVARKPED